MHCLPALHNRDTEIGRRPYDRRSLALEPVSPPPPRARGPEAALGEIATSRARLLHLERAGAAAAAAAAGYFTGQILPVEVPGKKGAMVVDADEHVRPGVSLDDMARLRPAFTPGGTVTAGNAFGLNDAAAAVVLASGSFVASSGLTPIGRLAGYAHAGVEPRIMGMGRCPRPARCWTAPALRSTRSTCSR
jgi:acetyl-CoA acetyltransferase